MKIKLRVGVISSKREDALNIKANFPDLNAVHAKTVFDFITVAGSNKIDAIVFLDEGTLSKEMKNIHTFIRSKHSLKKIPCLILSNNQEFRLEALVLDPSLRFYYTGAGIFGPILSFLTAVQNQANFDMVVPPEKIRDAFAKSLTARLGQGSNFTYREAVGDESRAGFFCQRSDELSTNLVWIKFVARILNDNSSGLKGLFTNFSEEEIEETSDKILSTAFDDFKIDLKLAIIEQGAVFLPPTDSLAPVDRNALVKQGKSKAVMYESSICNVMLEEIRYI
jgi:hypothetical protein